MGRSQQLPRQGSARGPLADDAGCSILHIDMDAFYASVELRRRPELVGKPVIVGGIGNRGVVCSATYEARTFGVRSAMPVARALRLCPQAIVLPGDMATYADVSRSVLAIFRDVTPLVEPLSLDEAFLDVTGAHRRLGSAATIGAAIRAQVEAAEHITCSVGVATTKFVAKVASALCKPDGMLVVPATGVLDFLHPLPIAALWGVGEVTQGRLESIGIRSVGDLARTPIGRLERVVGKAHAEHLSALARGHDPRAVEPAERDKSIGHEETFDVDIAEPGRIHRELLRLASRTAHRLRDTGQRARTVSIKVRLADFTTLTRSKTLERPTDVGQEMYAVARDLFDAIDRAGAAIRLVGVRGEGLLPAGDGGGEQLLLGEPEHGWRDADAAMDAAVRRFGPGVVQPATLVRAGVPRANPGGPTRGELRPT